MNENYIRNKLGIFVNQFPFLRLCSWQQDAFEMSKDANSVIMFVPRRSGKSTLLSFIFWYKLILEKDLWKFGQEYVCSHPSSGQLYSSFAEDWFLTSFGGKQNVSGDINDIFIPMPSRYLDYFNDAITNKGVSYEIKELLDLNDNLLPVDNNNPLYSKIEDTLYVKLFAKPLKSTGKNLFQGTLFNGAVITLIAANHQFDRYVSGKSVYGLWAEELGVWKSNLIAEIALPAIIEKDGFVIGSGTPSKDMSPKEHWTYKSFILPLKEYQKEIYHNVDYYYSYDINSIDILGKQGEVETLTNKSKKVIIIGDYCKMFPYTPSSIKGFLKTAGEVKKEMKAEMMLDENQNIRKDTEGNPLYRVVLGKDRQIGEMDIHQFNREYRMSFESTGGMGARVIDNFDPNVHIIDIQELDIDLTQFPKIMGFDAGSGKTGIENLRNSNAYFKAGHKQRSMTCFVQGIYIGNNQFIIYKEGHINFEYELMGRLWYSTLVDGCPILYDYSIHNGGASHRGVQDSTFSRTMQLYPSLGKARFPNTKVKITDGLIRGSKQDELPRIANINKLFIQEDKDFAFKNCTFPELNKSQIYIDKSCVLLCEFLEKWNYKERKIRDDLWDCLSYILCSFLYDPLKRADIIAYWDQYNRNQKFKKYKINRLNTVSKVFDVRK